MTSDYIDFMFLLDESSDVIAIRSHAVCFQYTGIEVLSSVIADR